MTVVQSGHGTCQRTHDIAQSADATLAPHSTMHSHTLTANLNIATTSDWRKGWAPEACPPGGTISSVLSAVCNGEVPRGRLVGIEAEIRYVLDTAGVGDYDNDS